MQTNPSEGNNISGIEPNGCFVGGITAFITEEHIRVHFEKYGEVTKIDYPKMKKNRLAKGYCHVYFRTKQGCNMAIRHTNHFVKGVKLKVKRAVDPKVAKKISKENQARKVFVANLPQNINEKTIKKIMESFGPVESVVMQHSFKNNVKKFKGYAFVLMENELDAKRGLLAKQFEFDNRIIQIKPALPKGLSEDQAISKGILNKYYKLSKAEEQILLSNNIMDPSFAMISNLREFHSNQANSLLGRINEEVNRSLCPGEQTKFQRNQTDQKPYSPKRHNYRFNILAPKSNCVPLSYRDKTSDGNKGWSSSIYRRVVIYEIKIMKPEVFDEIRSEMDEIGNSKAQFLLRCKDFSKYF